MENDPWKPDTQPITVSMKPSAEYDSALLVFKGSVKNIRADLIEFFGLDEVKDTDTTYDVFTEAEAKARVLSNPTTSTKSYGKPGGFKKGDAPKAEPVQVDVKTEPVAEEPKAEESVADQPTHDEAVANAKTELNAETIKEDNPAHPHADLLAAIEAVDNKRDLIKLTQRDEWKAFLLKGPSQDPDCAAAFRAKNVGFGK